MRFVIALTATLACAPILLVTAVCDEPTCSSSTFLASAGASSLDFPEGIANVELGTDGDSALLPAFEALGVPSTCGTSVTVQAEITSSFESQDMLSISVMNAACFAPVENGMTAIHTAGLIAQLDAPTDPSPYCLARYDTDTATFTCIQPCASDSAYSCYIGVDAILALYSLDADDTEECNAVANLPVAGAAAPVPNIETLSFSAQNKLQITTRHRQYLSRQAPQISIGPGNCDPSIAWDLNGNVVNLAGAGDPDCYQDWIATYDWEDLGTSACFESAPSAESEAGNGYLRYSYKVTMIEKDELYIRPQDETNEAVFRTTTTTQPFSVLVQKTAEDTVIFRAFDYSNVVSIVTSASFSMIGTDGRLTITVFSTVQSQFEFLPVGDATNMALANSGLETWVVTNTASDIGGDAAITLTFQVEADNDCSLQEGAFNFQVKVQCVDGTDPSDCPIENNGYETLTIEIDIPEMDVCESSTGTDLTAELYVFGSANYEDRQAFFTQNRSQDFVYVLALLKSTDITIDGCDVIEATAQLDLNGESAVTLRNNENVQWENVGTEMTASSEYPESSEIGFVPATGSCLIMYKFNPNYEEFPVPYDQDLDVTITFTLQATLPTNKRQLNTASASTKIILVGPTDSESDQSSTANTVAAPLIASLALAALALFF